MTPASREPLKMPTLARSVNPGSVNASPATNSETVNPIPATAARPTTWLQLVPGWQFAEIEPHCGICRSGDANDLAEDQSCRDSEGDRRSQGVDNVDRPEVDSGIGQGEERNDHERAPADQFVLVSIERGDGLIGDFGQEEGLVVGVPPGRSPR